MRGGGHDARRQTHHCAHRLGHGRSTQRLSAIGMPGLVTLHLLDDCPRTDISHRQSLEVTREVTLDLTLGLDHETERVTITETPSHRTEQQRATVPDRVEQRGPRAKFRQALTGPGEMIALFYCCFLEKRLQTRIGAGGRLTFIQGLSADLANMIDAHERAGLAPLDLAKRDRRAIADVSQRPRTPSSGRGRDRTQRAADARQQTVLSGQAARY